MSTYNGNGIKGLDEYINFGGLPFVATLKTIINWQMTRVMTKTNTKQEIDGVFQISLNESGKCTIFKQCRFTK